jgi:hypothetical protein
VRKKVLEGEEAWMLEGLTDGSREVGMSGSWAATMPLPFPASRPPSGKALNAMLHAPFTRSPHPSRSIHFNPQSLAQTEYTELHLL